MTTGVAAAAQLRVDRVDGRQRIRWSHAWPVVLRPTGEDQVHLVHGAGGPLGGDVLGLDVEVGECARLRVGSAGATLAQPGPGAEAARWDTTIRLAPGARLGWAPEPTIVTDGAAIDVTLRLDMAAGASAAVREVVVLGRHGHRGGRYHGSLVATFRGEPLLAHTTVLDGADAALSGPGGAAGARAVGTLLLAGDTAGDAPTDDRDTSGERRGVRWAWTPLAGPGALLLAVGDPGPVMALLAEATSATSGVGRSLNPGSRRRCGPASG
ncbi:urease accessory protein UreD [Pseudonocardia sp. GCM10023141]|uniref:urease accessory protein UreD n=1 Tax=Pseudonocardia sp. GCM10023141 TaxID=3252653 RepID=UPI003617D1E6